MLTHIINIAKEKIERYKRKSDTISDNDQEMKKMVRLYLNFDKFLFSWFQKCLTDTVWNNDHLFDLFTSVGRMIKTKGLFMKHMKVIVIECFHYT